MVVQKKEKIVEKLGLLKRKMTKAQLSCKGTMLHTILNSKGYPFTCRLILTLYVS